MKTTVIFLTAILMSAMTFGQTNPQFRITEKQETISIDTYLKKNIQYSQEKAATIVPGTEVISFTVTAYGELNDFRVISSVSSYIDEEMVRILKETSGNWQAGSINGEAVDMKHEVSISFFPTYFDPLKQAKKYMAQGNKLMYTNPRRALKYINEAYRIYPFDVNVLTARSLCKFEMGDVQGAIEDYNRIISLENTVGTQSGNSYADILAIHLNTDNK